MDASKNILVAGWILVFDFELFIGECCQLVSDCDVSISGGGESGRIDFISYRSFGRIAEKH